MIVKTAIRGVYTHMHMCVRTQNLLQMHLLLNALSKESCSTSFTEPSGISFRTTAQCEWGREKTWGGRGGVRVEHGWDHPRGEKNMWNNSEKTGFPLEVRAQPWCELPTPDSRDK